MVLLGREEPSRLSRVGPTGALPDNMHGNNALAHRHAPLNVPRFGTRPLLVILYVLMLEWYHTHPFHAAGVKRQGVLFAIPLGDRIRRV